MGTNAGIDEPAISIGKIWNEVWETIAVSVIHARGQTLLDTLSMDHYTHWN